jgi:WD40 repeat protein
MQIIRDPLSSSPVHSLCSLPGNQIAVGTENKWFNVWTLHQKPSVLETGPKTWGLFSYGTKSIVALTDGCLAAAIDDSIVIVDTTGSSYMGIKAVLEGSGNYGPGHNGSAECVTQSPDGRIISGGGDHDIIVWGLDRKRPEKYLRPTALRTHSICCTKDGIIIAGHDNGLLTIWDLTTYEQRATLNVSEKAVRSICLLPSSQIAAGSDDGLISIWTLSGPLPSGSLPPGSLPFGSKVCQLSFKGFRGPIRAVCFHPNGSLISGSEDGLVMSWNLATGLCTRVVEQGAHVTAVAILEDGRIAAGLENGQVKIWNP